jgi:hypothetical protein
MVPQFGITIDAQAETITVEFRDQFAIKPVKVVVPFLVWKGAYAQVLAVELAKAGMNVQTGIAPP